MPIERVLRRGHPLRRAVNRSGYCQAPEARAGATIAPGRKGLERVILEGLFVKRHFPLEGSGEVREFLGGEAKLRLIAELFRIDQLPEIAPILASKARED